MLTFFLVRQRFTILRVRAACGDSFKNGSFFFFDDEVFYVMGRISRVLGAMEAKLNANSRFGSWNSQCQFHCEANVKFSKSYLEIG